MLQKLATVLYLSGDHTPFSKLTTLLNATQDEIEKVCNDLDAALLPLGLTLIRVDNGVSIVTLPSQSELVQAFWQGELQGDLTPAALQVLTLVAYLGSGTREQISYIRGVQSTQSIRMLTVRGLITRNAEVCTLTVDAFKELGITKVEELPEYQSIHSQLIEKLEARIT